MKKWVLVAGFNVVLVAALLILIEFGLHFTPFDAVRNPPAGNPPGYYVADSELGVRIAENYPPTLFKFRGPGHKVYSNELGCFDAPVKLAKNEPYMLAIGDSFTWGYNPLETKWTSLLERKLGIRVLKCGVPGTGTKYQLKHLKRILAKLPHPPATVTHLYDTTDFNDDFIFPGETVIDGRRVENYESVRLSDGKQFATGPRGTRGTPGQIYVNGRNSKQAGTVLGSLVRVGLTLDSQIKKRQELLEGYAPEYLRWRYEFNLLLLDPGNYSHVAAKLEEHIETLREIGMVARQAGARYVLFHTNSFRLPGDAPLVATLEREFARLPGFSGKLPELGRHLFDPHWNAESEKQVAGFMAKRLQPRRLLSRRAPDQKLR